MRTRHPPSLHVPPSSPPHLPRATDYSTVSCPSLKGDGYYYYTYNSGLQAQAPFYRIKASELPSSFPENQERPGGELFYDPNRISRDGTASIALSAFSETGKYWAYGVSRSGSDWSTVYGERGVASPPQKPPRLAKRTSVCGCRAYRSPQDGQSPCRRSRSTG